MSINYVIATYNGGNGPSVKGTARGPGRMHKVPLPKDVLKIHLKKIIELSTKISQITIMKASSSNFYPDYYDIGAIAKTTEIPIKIIECENFGYSGGQWLKAYEIFRNKFDFFLFMEDDYCPNMLNYEDILINAFKIKFPNGIGLLCSLVEGSSDYKSKGGYPIHFEGGILINEKTLERLYQCPKWQGNPRKYLDLIDSSIDPHFDWQTQREGYIGGYYQVTFSHIFTLSGIRHKDYLDVKHKMHLLQFGYWADPCLNILRQARQAAENGDYVLASKLQRGWEERERNGNIGGRIHFYKRVNFRSFSPSMIYTIGDVLNSPIIPIQLYNTAAIKFNTPITC